jgi:transglutaminase-like putative cysteine protease
MKKNFRDLLCLGIIAVFYHFAVLRSVLIPMHTPVKGWQMLLFSFAAILFFFLVQTRPGRIAFFCTIGLGVCYIAYVLIKDGTEGLAETFGPVVEIGKAIVQISSGYYNETVPDAMLMWTVGLYALVLAIPVYYFLVPRLRFYWLIVPGLGLFVALWAMFRHVDKLSFYIYITIAIVCFIHYKYILYRKKDSEKREIPSGTNTIVFFIPVALLVLLTASVFKVKNTPIQWPWLDEKINKWYWDLHEKYNVDRYDHFSLEKTGFGDPARLGGPVYPDYTPIMVVRSPARVYLRGAVYDEYTGVGWNKTENGELADISDRAMDHLELRYGWKASGVTKGLLNLRAYREYLEQNPERLRGESTQEEITQEDLTQETQEGSTQEDSKQEEMLQIEQQQDSITIIDYDGNMGPPLSLGDDLNTQVTTIHSSVGSLSNEQILEEIKEDPLEYLNFLRAQQIPQLLNKLHPEATLTVRHLQVRTKTLFTPLKTYVPINGLPGYILTESPEGTFAADTRLQRESEYFFNYVQPAYGMEVLNRYFNSSNPGLYQKFRELNGSFLENLEDYGIVNVENVRKEMEDLLQVYEDLENYRNAIYSRYTKLPDTIPARVRDLALNLVMNEQTTYAKVQALEKYLRSNFTYTLRPDVPPEDQDFVDYFMFEGKEGYCSYFASALCVLARAAGIPARYVEGFVMPDKHDENGFYHVTNQYAHAWVEVYLEGVGWVTFEPTPPYAGVMNYFVSLQEFEGTGYYQELPPEIPDQYQYMRRELPDDFVFINNGKNEFRTVTVLLWAGAGILALLLLNLIGALLHQLVLRFMSARKSIPALYRYMVRLLRQVGCVSKLGETPKDFAKRVDERFQFTHMTMVEMVELFYSVRFGTHCPDKKSLNRIFAFTRELKVKTGRAMYLHKRLLLRGLLFRG